MGVKFAILAIFVDIDASSVGSHPDVSVVGNAYRQYFFVVEAIGHSRYLVDFPIVEEG